MTSRIQWNGRGVRYKGDYGRNRNKDKEYHPMNIHQWYLSGRKKTLHNRICNLWLWQRRAQNHGTGEMWCLEMGRMGKISYSLIPADKKPQKTRIPSVYIVAYIKYPYFLIRFFNLSAKSG